jgi:hypothetical protein
VLARGVSGLSRSTAKLLASGRCTRLTV